MATQYTPPWYIALPAGLTIFYDDSSGTRVWTSPQVSGSFSDLPSLVSVYNSSSSAGLAANPTLNESAFAGDLSKRAGKLFRQQARPLRLGPITTDITTFALSAANLAGATKQVTVAAAGVATANVNLFDWGPGHDGISYYIAAAVWVAPLLPTPLIVRPIRFMTDAKFLSIALYYGTGHGVQVFVDNVPVQLAPVSQGNGATFYANLTFPTATARLIEVRTDNLFGGVFIDPLASVWKPKQPTGPKLMVVGDSLVAGFYATYNFGFTETLADYLDLDWVANDGIGGTGYLWRTAGNNNYLDRLAGHTVTKPDVVLVHGGLNDLSHGVTTAQLIPQIITYFTALRTALPNAKLIYMEPMISPIFAAYASAVATVNAAARAALPALGNVYFIDTTTSGAWITGTGYQGATNGSGNSDLYIFTDATHPNDAGTAYLRGRVVPQLLPILAA